MWCPVQNCFSWVYFITTERPEERVVFGLFNCWQTQMTPLMQRWVHLNLAMSPLPGGLILAISSLRGRERLSLVPSDPNYRGRMTCKSGAKSKILRTFISASVHTSGIRVIRDRNGRSKSGRGSIAKMRWPQHCIRGVICCCH